MWADPSLWVTIAFITFFVLFGKKLWRFLAQALDKRSAQIARELKEAESLRQEAEDTLSAYKKKYEDSMREAEEIIVRARASSETMITQAEAEINASLERRVAQAETRIAEEEKRAVAEVRNHVVDITIAAARSIVMEHIQQMRGDEIVRDVIADMERKIH